MKDAGLYHLAKQVAERFEVRGQRLALAESCTGGFIAKCLTDVAGSSQWFECALVTYSNSAKADLLGIDPALIVAHGAVSRVVVQAMAEAVLQRCAAHWSIAVSGVAGPGGGTDTKPVGTVYIAWAERHADVQVRRYAFSLGRDAVRRETVAAALGGLLERS